jgi:hypothetical protein
VFGFYGIVFGLVNLVEAISPNLVKDSLNYSGVISSLIFLT